MTFSGHLEELRRRLTFVAIALIAGLVLGWVLQEPLTQTLLKPLGDKIYYSNPTGALDFLMSLSISLGVILALPIAIYQALKYIEPIAPSPVAHRGITVICLSLLLALAGASFAYFVSLPSALNFLSSFDAMNVSPLISAKEYLTFTMTYILVFALVFQLPLIMSFIDRIKPLKPRKLIKKQRWVILASFIIAAFATPTPDPINQSIMALPLIILFNISIVVIVLQHTFRKVRGHHSQTATAKIPVSLVTSQEKYHQPINQIAVHSSVNRLHPPNLKHVTDPQLLTIKDSASGKVRPFVRDILMPIPLHN